MARIRKPKSRPAFFKILINNGVTHQLELPPDFVTKYGGMLPSNVKLRTGSGRLWPVKIELSDDRKFGLIMTKGWSNFAKDLRLEDGELVVFSFNSDKSMFDVSAFGTNGCGKEVLGIDSVLESDQDDDVDLVSIDQGASRKRSATCIGNKEDDGSRPSFDIVLKEHQPYCVTLPKDFSVAADLIGKKTAVLKYQPRQQYGAVMLKDRGKPSHRLDMTVGWNNFVKENGLFFGKTYSLTFNPAKKVIEVKPAKRKMM